jgi:lysophospholipase L1-like esterase
MNRLALLFLVFGFGACTPDVASEPGSDGVVLTDVDAQGELVEDSQQFPCPVEAPGVVRGRVYVDENRSDLSVLKNEYESGVDSPVQGQTMRLYGSGQVWEAETCEDGSFDFFDIQDGVYVVGPVGGDGDWWTTTKNSAGSFLKAVERGNVTLVTIGDSIPVVGDGNRFPTRLKKLIGQVVDVESRNIAIGGTTSPDWAPGKPAFVNLIPHIADADVVIISLGGNDILGLAIEMLSPLLSGGEVDIEKTIEAAHALVNEIADNIRAMTVAIRAVKPEIDIVFCLYPDYTEAGDTFPWSLAPSILGEGGFEGIVEEARDALKAEDGVILADVYEASLGLNLDDYLHVANGQADPIHLGPRGHILYAEQIFLALGGVIVGGESPLGEGGVAPLGLSHHYGRVGLGE